MRDLRGGFFVVIYLLMTNRLAVIKELKVFKNLPQRVFHEIDRICIPRKFSKGEMIYVREKGKDKVFLLIAGRAKLYSASTAGKKITIQVFKPGDIFGDLPFAENNILPEESSIQAEEPAFLCIIPKKEFADLLKSFPELAMMLIAALRHRLAQAESKIKDLALSPAQVRLINELIRYALNHGKEVNGFYQIDEKLTHQSLAEMIGVTRETVTKTLNALKKLRFINYRPGGLITLNRDKIIKDCILCLKPDTPLQN